MRTYNYICQFYCHAKVIDCEKQKERAPENGVENLITTTCFAFSSSRVTCYDTCPAGNDPNNDCDCGFKVYEQGTATCCQECAVASEGYPLAELTALVIFQPPCYYIK